MNEMFKLFYYPFFFFLFLINKWKFLIFSYAKMAYKILWINKIFNNKIVRKINKSKFLILLIHEKISNSNKIRTNKNLYIMNVLIKISNLRKKFLELKKKNNNKHSVHSVRENLEIKLLRENVT